VDGRRRSRARQIIDAATPGGAAADENQRSISFFERLDVVIDTYMQEKKPVAQVKAAKAGH